MEPLQKEKYYTYSDYVKWDDETRCELIGGEVYMMSPAPTRFHQKIIGKLFWQLENHLQGKPCEVYLSPFDVRLNAAEEDDTVVQPDLLIICDKSKLTDAGCDGAPDMVVEILSPSTAHKDRLLKFRSYQKYGVREYWIIDPVSTTLQACILTNGKYETNIYDANETAPVFILDGCGVDLKKVFDE